MCLTLASGSRAFATSYTETVPNGNGPIPATYPPVGGTMFVFIGANGNIYYQFVNPSTQFEGFQLTGNPVAFQGAPEFQLGPTQALNCGAVTCTEYFGGSIVEGYARLTARDGDSCPGNFDYQDLTFRVNGIDVANFSDLPANSVERTSFDGSTSIGFEDCFRDQATTETSTGWFDLTGNPALLNDILTTGSTTPTINDADGWETNNQGDNRWFFRDGNDATGTPEVAPGITIEKSADVPSYAAVGDIINYEFLVTNIGSVVLNDVVVTDTFISAPSVSCPATTIPLFSSMTCTAQHVVSQANIDNDDVFVNTAQVTANPTEGTIGDVSGTLTIPGPAANITGTITKLADVDTGLVLNDVVTYTYEITNTGNITWNDVTVSDAHGGAGTLSAISPAPVTLAPGASQTFTATYTITQADIDAGGPINNTASVSATPARGTLPTISADESVALVSNDELTVAKPAPANADEDGSADVTLGDTLTYTITVTNSGTTTQNNVIVSDALITPSSNTCPTVAPGATCALTGDYTVTQADVDAGSIDNTASVVSDEITTPVEGTNSQPVAQNSVVTIVKPAPANADEDGSTDVTLGDTLTYTITATNSGTTTLNNVTVSDPILTPNSNTCLTVAPGATCVLTGDHVVTQADVDAGTIDNTAGVVSDEITTPVEDTNSQPVAQTSALTIVKPAPANADEDGSTDVSVGDTLTYTITATNSGTTTQNNVTVSDALLTPGSNVCVTVAPGATCVLTGDYTVTQADVDAGKIDNTAGVVSDEVTTPVEATNSQPVAQTDGLSIVKPAPANADEDGSTDVSVGDTLTYTITATNSGTTTLNNVTVSDPLITPSSNVCATLAPNATCVLTGNYTVTQADVDAGKIDNTASAVSDEITTPEQAMNTQPVGQNDALSIVKPAPANADEDGSADVSLGDTLTYTITATNSGTTTLNNVTVSDPLITPSSTTCGTVAPGATCVLTGNYTVTQTDVDTGSIANTAGVVSDEVTTPEQASNNEPVAQDATVTIAKPAPANADEDGSADVTLGDTLTYTVTATNSGTITLTNVMVSDPMLTPNLNTCPSVAPGTTCVLTGNYTVTQADVDAGSIDNTAMVASIEIATPESANQSEPVAQTDALSIVKPAPANADEDGSTDVSVGDTLTYTITATNSGTTTLNNVTVSDPLLTPMSKVCATLAPNATCVLTGDYTVSQADVDAGSIDNIAGVVSDEITTPEEATNSQPVAQTDALSIVKPAPANADEDGTTDVSVGDTLTYTVTATNSGTTTLNNVVVSDPLITPTSTTCVTLAPGVTCVLTGDYTVTQADVDAGSIANTAGVISDEIPTPEEASNTEPVAQTDALSIVKPAPANADEDGSAGVSAGDTLTYTITATNSGTTTLNNVVVSDALITPSSNTCVTLAPNATCVLTGNYTVTQADVDAGSIMNTAGVVSDEITVPEEASNTEPVAQDDALSIVKPAPANADEDGSTDISVGDTLTYTITATNSGTTTLNNVVVSDPLLTPSSTTCGVVAPTGTCVLTGDYTVTQADVDAGSIVNTAGAVSDEITTPEEASNTAPVAQTDELTIVKPAPSNADEDSSATVSVGDTLTYTITATNSGTTTLNNVTVSDALVTPSSNVCATVAPGTTCVLTGDYTVTQADVDAGSIVNTAEVVSDEITTPEQASNTTTPEQKDELTIVKPAPANADEDGSTDVSLGDTLTYTVTATNSGTTTLNNVTISDPILTPNTITCALVAPGQTCVLTGDYSVAQTDVDNGSVDNTASVVSDEITTPETANQSQPVGQFEGLSIDKPAPANADEDGSGNVSAGDTLTYTVTATNSGTTTLSNVVVSDALITPNTTTCPTVAPGTTCVLTGDYTVTQADVDAGSITNTASTVSDEVTTPEQDSNTTPVAQTDELSIAKPAPANADEDGSGDVSVGDTLTYTVTATNSGTTTLNNVTVSDPLITPNSTTCATLAPTGTCILTGNYSVIQADVDAGSIANTAGVVSDEIPVPEEASNTQPVGQNDELTIVKAAPANADEDGSGDVSAGDTLTYTVTATNSGTTTLTNVTVSDPLITPSSTTCGTVAPGTTCVLTGDYTVTQADVDNGSIVNTAGVVSDEITTPVEDGNTQPVGQNAALSIDKPAPANADEDGSADVSQGDTLTYTVTVTNSGSVTQTNVMVSDAMITPSTKTCVTLAPGATCVLTGNYTVTQADVDAGTIDNTAMAASVEVPTPVNDNNSQPVGQNDAITIAKPAPANADQDGSGDVSVGDTLTYTVTATNSGTTTLNNVTVTDAMITPSSNVCATLAPNAICQLVGTYTVVQSDIDNGSIVNTAGVTSDEITTPEETNNTTPTGQNDALSIDKPAPANADQDGSGDVTLGDTLTYTVTATNSGTTTLSNIVVSDPLITPSSVTCPVLTPNATCVLTGSYVVTQADVDVGAIANTAGVVSDEITTPVEDTNNSPTSQTPDLMIVKPTPANADQDGSGDVSVGDTLTYTITATNTGTTTLNSVEVVDPLLTPGSQTCATVAPNATCVLVGSYVVTQANVDVGSVVNTAGVTSDEVTNPVQDTNTTPTGQTPAVTLDKPAPVNADEDGSGNVSVGDTLTYTITATNTGTISLNNVNVTDALITPSSNTCGTVAPSATCVLTGDYTVTQADVDAGAIDNTASVVSDEITTPEEASNTTNIGQTPDVTIVKPIPTNADEDGSADISLGDTLTYTITATNTGTVTLNNVVVSDPMTTPSSNTCLAVAPGNTCELTGNYTVVQTDIDNGAITNTASVVSDETPTPDTASNTSGTGSTPAVTLAKPAPLNADEDSSGDVSVGDTLTYTVTATNSGTVSLNNVVVSDAMITPNMASCAVVAPTATCVLTGDYTVTQADVDAGSILNTAEVVSDEITTPVTDDNNTSTGQLADLTVVKPTPANADEDGSGDVSVGDTLTYTVTATNSGTITLNNVVVSDALITPTSTTCVTLAPGAVCTLSGDYTVTQADVDAGTIDNTAGAVSDEITTPVEDTNSTTPAQNTALDIVKAAPVNADEDGSGGLSAGDTLTYTITATNTGTTTQSNVMVSDAMITPSSATCATLAPGAVCTLSGDYTVTQADVDTGSIVNTASAGSDEVIPPVTDDNTSPVDQVTELAIDKAAPTNADQDASGDITVNDTLTYTVTATNTGTITLNNVIVSDAMITPNSQVCPTLAPSATCVLTGAYSVTQADVDAGGISNTAGVISDETPAPVEDTENTPTSQMPELTVVKADPVNADEDGSGDVSIGDTLTYTVTATNSGSITLNNVVVSDSLITPNTTSCATLPLGTDCILTGTYTVTQADIDNGTINNTAGAVSDEVTTPVEDSVTTNTGQFPELTVVKSDPTNTDQDASGDITVGDNLTYTITVTNSGTITQNNVVVSDQMITPSSQSCAVLAPGAICTLTGSYVVTQADVDSGAVVNTASAVSDEVTTPSEDTNNAPTSQNSDLTLDKPAPVNADEDGSGGVSLGDTLTYTITATNAGSISVNNVVLSDAMITPSTNSCAVLAPGATCVLTGNYTVTQADVDAGNIFNTASVVSDETPNPTNGTNDQPVDQAPELSLDKPAPVNADQDASGNITEGDTLTYTITATNTGTVTLNNVAISDAMITPDTATCPTVAPGATCVLSGIYTVAQADIDNGAITNSASATSDETPTPVTDDNTQAVDQTPELSINKPAPANADEDGSGTVTLGDTLTYTITATNTGNVSLTNVMVNDPMTTPTMQTCATLAVGDDCVLTGTYTVTQADVDAGGIDNTAMVASVEIPDPVSDTNSTNVVQMPGLGLEKPAPANADEDGSGDVSLGDTLTYTVTATNTGTLTLNNVVVSDPLIVPSTQTCATLAPGATCVLSGAYSVAQDDVNAGNIANTASATSDETTNPVNATNDQPVVQTSSLAIIKPAPVNADEDGSTNLSLNDMLTYTVTATNTGTTTQTNVVVSDAMITPNTASCPVVLPGDNCVLTGTYEVTQADVDAGEIINNATANSDQSAVDVDATQTSEVDQTGSIAVQKVGVVNNGQNGYANLDDTITYTFTVTNTGVVTLTNIELDDPLVEVQGGPIASLAPGESDSTTFTATYFISELDLENQEVVNTATVSGDHPNGFKVNGLSDDPTDVENVDTDGDGNPDDPTITPILIGPTSIVQPLSVTKTTPYRDVSFGDLVPYEITITNLDDFDRNNLTYVDLMPTGFNYVPDSARIDGIAATPVVTGNRVTFPNQTLAADESVTINLVLMVGAGVTEGEYVNQAFVESSLSGRQLSEIGEATVIVGPTPVFDCSEIIGKVFDDRNLDGYQNPGEEGIADVRVVTVKGQRITTDDHGRFHIACAEIPNGQIGSNFILKLDPRSLPTGYRITTENPRVVRLTRGKLTKLNFGATRPRIVTLDLSQQVFVPNSPLLAPQMKPNIDMLIQALQQEQSMLRINYHAVPGEPAELIQNRMDLVADHINTLWESQRRRYDLTIEAKTIRMGAQGATGYRP